MLQSVNAVCLIPLSLNCFGYCIYIHILLTYSPLYFQNKTYGASIPFRGFQPHRASCPGELLWLSGKEHCNDLDGAKRQEWPACRKELEKWVWCHYQKCRWCPGPRWSQLVSDCPVGAHMHPHQLQLGTVYLLIIFYPPPLTSPISSGRIFIKNGF